jgi:hypothetical protein
MLIEDDPDRLLDRFDVSPADGREVDQPRPT